MSVRAQAKREEMLAELHAANPAFQKACMDFISDLRQFGRNDRAKKRLEDTGDQYYIGQPYFNDDTRRKILELPITTGILQNALDGLAAKRQGSTICASHDLSPIFEAALGVTWDKTKGRASATVAKSVGSGLTFRAKTLIKQGSQMFKKGKRGGQ
jgi:hypothetical protein